MHLLSPWTYAGFHAVAFAMSNHSSCNENIVLKNSLFVKVHLEYLREMRAPVRFAWRTPLPGLDRAAILGETGSHERTHCSGK
jgi:hypothetical protein